MYLIKNKKYHRFNQPLTVKEDIVSYKKLVFFDGKYYTPCDYNIIPIECIQNKIPFKAIILNNFTFILDHILGFNNIVENGFIRSFQYEPQSNLCNVFKCIIPKGTKYFIGEEGEYASREIIFLEKIS